MKKLWILFSLTVLLLGADGDLENYLRKEKNQLLDYQQQSNILQTGKLQRSWIAPVTVSYQKDWHPMPDGSTRTTRAFSIGIDQPIFKSGGILFGLRYAHFLRQANAQEIALQKRQWIAQAVEILFRYHKTRLQRRKLTLLVANDAIAVRRQESMYQAGMIDSSLLDQTILNHHRDSASLLDLDLALAQLRASFAYLSDKNIDKLRLPRLKLITLKQYATHDLKLAAEKLHALEKRSSSRMTWAQYLPTVTAYGHYRYSDEKHPGTMSTSKNYGVRISMTLSPNAPADIETARIAYLQAQAQVRDRRKTLQAEYRLALTALRILDRKIALAKRDEALYRRLLQSTRDLVQAGEKTEDDLQTMRNAQAIKRLDRRIYELDKQIELLKLYARMAP